MYDVMKVILFSIANTQQLCESLSGLISVAIFFHNVISGNLLSAYCSIPLLYVGVLDADRKLECRTREIENNMRIQRELCFVFAFII